MTKARQIRRYRRMSGIEVGGIIGIRPHTLYRYETGERKLPVDVAKKLGQVYGVPWTVFYEDGDDGTYFEG